MRYVYLEAGSGASSAISAETIAKVRALYDGLLIVGGGIRDQRTALAAIEAGADIIVVGNLIETEGFEEILRQISLVAHHKRSEG
jgi:phosphoglycerol geranylgeranyltransferase